MPTRYTKGNELQQFQYELANEVKRDAKPIADGVFGDNARHPDMASISNAELDRLYREAYARNDRAFLQQEASRDPQQFLAVTDRLGVSDPPLDQHGKPVGPDPSAPEQVLQNAAASPPGAGMGASLPQLQAPMPAALPPPVAPPAMVAPPVAPTVPPVILGPNGAPLQPPVPGGP
jgi:hypothetical protein